MAKGKYSRTKKDADADLVRKFSRALQEEEPAPMEPSFNPLDTHDENRPREGQRNMPQWDAEEFPDLDSLPDLNFPELSALDTQSEDSEYAALFSPIPQSMQEPSPQPAEIPGRHPRPRRRKAGGGRKLLISATVVMAAVFLVICSVVLTMQIRDPYNHQILNGVMAAGVNLGAMTREEAEAAVAEAAERLYASQDMVLHLPDQDLILSPADTKVRLDAKAAVKEAYEYGRTGTKQQQEQAFRKSMTETHTISLLPYLDADESFILEQLENYSQGHNSSYTPSSYALEGEQPPLDFEHYSENNPPQTLLLILGNPGFHLDPSQALADVMEAYSRMDLSPSLKLQSGDMSPGSLDLNRIHKEYHIDPVDSSMDPETFDIISGSYGYTFDLQQARKQLEEAHYGDTVRIPMEYVIPDTMDHEVYFQDVLSKVETPHNKNAKRNNNLTLACKAIDGLVLNPGEEFSYNGTLGQRTADKGYQAAPAYSGDTLVDTLGGGICQVSSTLYLSCMLADLEITDRINHGFLTSYLDPGMDAAVSWEKPDFKFRNNSEFPVKIQAEVTETSVVVSILGTDNKDYYISMEYEMSDVLPNEVYKEYDADSGYYNGQVVKEGTIGHYVKTYRCKYSKKTDVLISREFEARSSYMTRDRVIAVVKPQESKPTEPRDPEPTDPPAQTDPPAPADPSAPTDPPATNPPEPPATDPVPEPPAPSESGEKPES